MFIGNFFNKIFSDSNKGKKEKVDLISLNCVDRHFKNVDASKKDFNIDSTFFDKFRSEKYQTAKNIMILDDIPTIAGIIAEEIKEDLITLNIYDDFNIITFSTKDVGFIVTAFLFYTDVYIHYLITDLTFGGNNVFNGENLILDGVDICVLLSEKFNGIDFIIFSGNAINLSLDHPNYYSEKFKQHFGYDIEKKYFLKDANLSFSVEQMPSIKIFFGINDTLGE